MDRTVDFAPPRYVTTLDDCFFYHTLDLPGFGEQIGEWDLRDRFKDYTDQFDFNEKSVLDIGAGSGFLSISAEQAGAREVVSFDMDSVIRQDHLPFKDKLPYTDRAEFVRHRDSWLNQWKNAYWLSHRLLGSKARVYYGDIYALPEGLGTFDVVILGSILEHLADPVKAMASVARHAAQTILIVTPMLDTEEPIARFEGRAANPDMDYVFWIYALGVYREVLGMLGFEIAKVNSYAFNATWNEQPQQRHVITAQRI